MQNNSHEERIELKGFLAEFRDALLEEIDKIKKSGQSSTVLFAGRRIENHGADIWYRFNVEYVPTMPADTPCKLIIGKEQFDVTVISFEENTIVVSSKIPLPDSIGKARLENGATVLMERLIKCIEDNAEKENPAGKRMLATDGGVYSAKRLFEYTDLNLKSDNTESQNEAIKSALTKDITYIWGPPGTGKTTVIGQIIDELYHHNRSVLVVSHTNTAVDGAIEKADKTYSKSGYASDSNYPILRIGTPAKLLPERVLLSHHVKILGKELYEQKALLEKKQAQLQRRINEIRLLLAKDNWIKESNLAGIQIALHNIVDCKKRINEIQGEMDRLDTLESQEKASHPEYANFSAVSKALHNKKKDYDAICKEIKNKENMISDLPQQIQRAHDEKKKHSKYSELRAQESKYMSASFLREEIRNVDTQITHLKNSILEFSKQRDTAQQVINEYEKKNAVAKLFSGKGAVTQAQLTLTRILNELPDIESDFERKQVLRAEYSHQLEDLLLLQEQIRAVIPSNTPEFWNNEVANLEKKLRTSKMEHFRLSAQKTSLYAIICDLERQQKQAKPAFDRICDIEEKLQYKAKEKDLAEIQHRNERSGCFELLQKEYTLCSYFLTIPNFDDFNLIFEQMSSLLAMVKSEMSSINIGAVLKEKEIAAQQMTELIRQVKEINDKMQELEKQAIMSAKIIGTTLAKSYLSETLRERKFDTVILDEASMASIPALWCASYLAENNIVIVGDFLQLSPIVIADTPMAQKWLGKDIFYHSKMQECARNKATCPPNFVMLNNQFRMESDIADIANMYYGAYGGLLSDCKW